jgi:hypothetical protein
MVLVAGPPIPTMIGLDGTPIGSEAEWQQYVQRYIQSGMGPYAAASQQSLQLLRPPAQLQSKPAAGARSAPAKGGDCCSIM